MRLPSIIVLVLLLMQPAAAADRIVIGAVGDVMLAGAEADALAGASDAFADADLVIANLEGPLCDGGMARKTTVPGRRYAFRMPTSWAPVLAGAGFDVLGLANNHALDYGQNCLDGTRKAIEAAGLSHAGTDGSPAVYDVDGLRVAVAAYAFGGAPRPIADLAAVLDEIRSIAGTYDILVVTVHAGAEGLEALHVRDGEEVFLDERRGDIIAFAHGAVDAGADLVVGHGPHVPRALELYRDRLIAYSLGNFAIGSGISLRGPAGLAPVLLAELAADGRFVGGSIRSLAGSPDGHGPRVDAGNRAARLMTELTAEDFAGTSLDFLDDGTVVPLARVAAAR